jgi:hypothetical protein
MTGSALGMTEGERLGLFGLGLGFLGEHEEIVEDLLRELLVGEELPLGVGHDELVGLLAVANRVAAVLVVLDQTDDLELDRLSVVGLDDEDVPQLELRFVGAFLFVRAVPGAVPRIDDTYSLWSR